MTKGIAKDLYLNMAWLQDQAFEKDSCIAESCLGLTSCSGQLLQKVGGSVYFAHTFAATTGRSLDEQGKADALRLAHQHRVVLALAVVAWNGRCINRLRQLFIRN